LNSKSLEMKDGTNYAQLRNLHSVDGFDSYKILPNYMPHNNIDKILHEVIQIRYCFISRTAKLNLIRKRVLPWRI